MLATQTPAEVAASMSSFFDAGAELLNQAELSGLDAESG
jgi:hypothetical protein